MEIENRSAIVTGGGGGLGSATVKRLVDAGAHVVAFDLNADAAEALVATLDGRATAVAGDVTNDDDVAAAIEAAQSVAPLAELVKDIIFPKRMGEPEEFALLVESIVTNPYLNGENIRLDGALRFPPK